MRLIRVYTGPFATAQCTRIEAEQAALIDVPTESQLIAQLWAPSKTLASIAGIRVVPVAGGAPLAMARGLRALLRTHRSPVVYCHGVWSMLATALARVGIKRGSAFVYEIHGAAAFEALHSGKRFRHVRFAALYMLESLACFLADRIVLVSDTYAHYYPTARTRPRFAIPRLVGPPVSASPPGEIVRFAADARRGGRRIVVYSGSAARYQLPAQVVAFMRRLVDEEGFVALVLSQDREVFDELVRREGGPGEYWLVASVPRETVHASLKLCDLGVLLRSPAVLNAVASPTKLYEYLAAGLRVATTAVIREAVAIVNCTEAGVVFQSVDEALLSPDAPKRCRLAVDRGPLPEAVLTSFTWKPDSSFHDFVLAAESSPPIPELC